MGYKLIALSVIAQAVEDKHHGDTSAGLFLNGSDALKDWCQIAEINWEEVVEIHGNKNSCIRRKYVQDEGNCNHTSLSWFIPKFAGQGLGSSSMVLKLSSFCS